MYIFYPDDPFQNFWDLGMAVILIFTCMVTPYRIALVEKDNFTWQLIINTVDILFLLDMIVIFNAAYFDDDFILISDRKRIGLNYLRGWFIIDLFAIIPFDYLIGGSNLNSIVRITRIGKMYKLVKLTRLLRVAKMVKEKSKFAKYMQRIFNIGIGM